MSQNRAHRDPKDLIPLRDIALETPQPTPEDARLTLRTRLAWDIVPDDKIREWAHDLLMNPPSEEVAKVEAAAAQIRLNHLDMILPMLSDLALTAGDVVYRPRLLTPGSSPSREPDAAVAVRDDEGIVSAVRAGVFAVVAELLDMGVLAVVVRVPK